MNKAIVFIAGGNLSGGGSRRFANIFAELVRRDPAAHFITNREHYEALLSFGWLPADTPNVHVLVNWKWLPQRQGRYLYGLLHGLQILWLVSYWRLRVIHLVISAVHVGGPVLLLPGVHGVVSILKTGFVEVYSRYTRLLYSLSLRRAALVDVLSDSIVPHILASNVSFPGLERKIRVSPCSFTDYARFQPASQKELWVVFAARFIDLKNPLLAVEVACRIVAQYAQAKVFILGEGPAESEMRQRLNTCEAKDRIELRLEKDMTPILARASIFLSLQALENYPSQSLLEAMASGCAIVATDVGDTARLVDESVGVRLPPDADQITKAVLQLLNDPDRCRVLGEAARHRVTTEHTVERFVDYLQALYIEAAASPGQQKSRRIGAS